jgi:protein-disulfide isomerase
MIVEFSEFQCPFCQKVQPTIKNLISKYGGQVSLAFRDFPLRQMHPHAQMAAEASRCASEQGKFWEYHDLLFADGAKLDIASLKEYAHRLGLKDPQFNSCLESGKFKARIEEDLQEAVRAGLSGTPAFFINGIFVNGAQPPSVFEKVIEAELAAKKYQEQGGTKH